MGIFHFYGLKHRNQLGLIIKKTIYTVTLVLKGHLWDTETRGSQEPVIAHLVFNLTSKYDRKWVCYT
jgi:hypothetical protein